MSLNDLRAEHVSKQIPDSENSFVSTEQALNIKSECNSTPYKRRRQTNQALEALGQLIKDSSGDDSDEKLNKNDILGLTISRLLRGKYVPFNLTNPNIPLASDLSNFSATQDFNGFLLVLNTSGRILFISDNAERHLRKNVRSLYSQMTNIYQCINEENHQTMQKILSNRKIDEQQMICTWNLPRGKRPSRAHAESKTILISGHYFYLQTDKNQYEQDPLFLAKCEQILSSTPNVPTNSLGYSSNTILKFTLNDQLAVTEVSSNIRTVLGYQAEDLINRPMAFLLTSEHWKMFLQAKENCICSQHRTTMDVLDMYNSQGDRLTFLCNTYAVLESKRKPVRLGFLAQLIDPYIREECLSYVKKQNDERLKSTTQTESLLASNMSLSESSITTNNSSILCFDQYLSPNSSGSVCPATVIPQRRKRRRNMNQIMDEPHPVSIKIKKTQAFHSDFDDSPLTFNSSSSSLSDSSSQFGSPTQEIGSPENSLRQVEGFFFDEKPVLIPDWSLVEDFNDLFGIDTTYHQSLFLTTPTLPTCSFFA